MPPLCAVGGSVLGFVLSGFDPAWLLWGNLIGFGFGMLPGLMFGWVNWMVADQERDARDL